MRSIAVFIMCLMFSTTSNAKEALVFANIGPLSEVGCQILTEAYGNIDISVDCEPYPAERAFLMSNSGVLDGEIHRVKGVDEKYKHLLMAPIPINFIEIVAFTRKDNITVAGWESLKPYKIGIRRGLEIIEKATDGMDRVIVNDDEQMFDMLSLDRIDVFVTTRFYGLHAIKKMKQQKVRIMEPPVTTIPLYHYLHENHRGLLPKITASLQQMKADGRIGDVRRQHMGDMTAR